MTRSKNKKGNLIINAVVLILILMKISMATPQTPSSVLELSEKQMDSINAGDASALAVATALVTSPAAATITDVGTVTASDNDINYAASYAAAVACCDNQSTSAIAETSVTGEAVKGFDYSHDSNYYSVAWSVSYGSGTH